MIKLNDCCEINNLWLLEMKRSRYTVRLSRSGSQLISLLPFYPPNGAAFPRALPFGPKYPMWLGHLLLAFSLLRYDEINTPPGQNLHFGKLAVHSIKLRQRWSWWIKSRAAHALSKSWSRLGWSHVQKEFMKGLVNGGAWRKPLRPLPSLCAPLPTGYQGQAAESKFMDLLKTTM